MENRLLFEVFDENRVVSFVFLVIHDPFHSDRYSSFAFFKHLVTSLWDFAVGVGNLGEIWNH